MKKEINTYLFDFDGTLVDSMPTFVSVMLSILDEYKIEYSPDIVKIITPLGYKGTAEYFKGLGVPVAENELVPDMVRRALYEYENTILTKPGVTEALTELKARGAELNILTASPHAALDPCLVRNGIWELFTNVWSCEDFGTTKANPEIYLMAAEKIGKKPDEIIFIDDNLDAVTTAKRAGMCAYGVYDETSRDYINEMRAVADGYIYSFTELLGEGE